MPRRAIALVAVAVLASSPVHAGDRFHVSGSVAAGKAGNAAYTTVGLGAGYTVLTGLEASVDGEAWLRSGGPDLYKLSPGLLYAFQLPGLSPYLGAFYRRTFVEGSADDFSSVGGRAGFFSQLGPHTRAGAGVVYEKILNCTDAPGVSCSSVYPEANVSFSF